MKIFLPFGRLAGGGAGTGGGGDCGIDGRGAGLGGAGRGGVPARRILGGRPAGWCGGLGGCSISFNTPIYSNSLDDLLIVNCLRRSCKSKHNILF